MCLFCLIGAVFSERVWLWAEERLRQALCATTPPGASTTLPVGSQTKEKSQEAGHKG